MEIEEKSAYSISAEMKELAGYLVGALGLEIPADVIEKGKHHLLDTLAAIISGSRLPPGQLAIRHAKTMGGAASCTVAGTTLLTNPVNAALANGIAAHADETDDSHLGGRFHPGCGIVPAALAAAEANGRSGIELLKAVILGYDIGVRFNMSLGPRKLYQGGHSTHSLGPLFGAAAAAGALYGFGEEQMRHHLSYTIQQASGVQCWIRDHYHSEKAFDFGGMPARNALTSATLIAHGFTGVDDALSGPNNFYSAFSTSPQPKELVAGLGLDYQIMQASIKKWCVGSPIQGAIDAVMELLAQRDFAPRDVQKIVIELPDDRANLVNNRTMPNVSVQHLVALAIVDKNMSFEAAHDYNRVNDPEIVALKNCTVLVPNPELTTALPPRQVILGIDLNDGTELHHRTHAVKGTPANPMTRQEVSIKARDLIEAIVGKDKADRLIDFVLNIEAAPDLKPLRLLLQA